ncbi:2582_t:CDS:2 [Ambispora gerdemannii]|uniref:2582_t:CDS:1 n=1 Tax=Ambispora gerdemannii TaxID=144530 RepID=A0A9N9FUX4_9GLOM|nr:2582_t:CDS:2 [Ambispora gerdemannii]
MDIDNILVRDKKQKFKVFFEGIEAINKLVVLTAEISPFVPELRMFFDNAEKYLPGFGYLYEMGITRKSIFCKNVLIMTNGYGFFAVVFVDEKLNMAKAKTTKERFVKENLKNLDVISVVGVAIAHKKEEISFISDVDSSIAAAIAKVHASGIINIMNSSNIKIDVDKIGGSSLLNEQSNKNSSSDRKIEDKEENLRPLRTQQLRTILGNLYDREHQREQNFNQKISQALEQEKKYQQEIHNFQIKVSNLTDEIARLNYESETRNIEIEKMKKEILSPQEENCNLINQVDLDRAKKEFSDETKFQMKLKWEREQQKEERQDFQERIEMLINQKLELEYMIKKIQNNGDYDIYKRQVDGQPDKLSPSTSNVHELNIGNENDWRTAPIFSKPPENIVDGPYLADDYSTKPEEEPQLPFSKDPVPKNFHNSDNLYDAQPSTYASPRYADLAVASQKQQLNTPALIKRLKLEKPVKGQRLLPLFGAPADDNGGNTSTETVVSFRDSSSTETSDTVVDNGTGRGLNVKGKDKIEQIRGKNQLVSPSEIEE